MRHILCFGNLWQGDDGFGIHVCRRLQAVPAAAGVRVFEVGLRSLDALPLFDGCREAILVDALCDPSLAAGTLCRLPAAQLAEAPAACSHGFGVGYLLRALAATHRQPPPATLVGAVIDRLQPFSDVLSAPLRPAVDGALALIGELLAAAEARR